MAFTTMQIIGSLDPPSPSLEQEALARNVARVAERCRERGVALRPHIRTPLRVSILREPACLLDQGTTDMRLPLPLRRCSTCRASLPAVPCSTCWSTISRR
jgi:hypothetical protein